MNYAKIKKRDIADGPGLRTALFVSGCRHHCPGCFNAETWDFNYGEPYTEAVEQEILDSMDKPYIRGITLLGGEPFEPENQPVVLGLLKKVKAAYPDKTIWSYSGYTYETDIRTGAVHVPQVTDELLSLLDVLVDGEFHIKEKNPNLRFKGSANQRLIDVKQSLTSGQTVLWNGMEEP